MADQAPRFSGRELASPQWEDWNSFVISHPQGTIFHTTGWLSAIGEKIRVFTVWESDLLIGGMALLQTVKFGTAGYHVPPYTQYFSPLYHHPKQKDSLSAEHDCIGILLDMISGAAQVDFKLPAGHQSILPYHWKGFDCSVSITHVITGNLEAYLQQLNKNKLRELKKLQALAGEGELTVGDDISREELEHLVRQTSERKKFNANNSIVCSLVENIDPSMARKVVVRSRTHGLLAFGFFPYDDKAVYNLVNASVRIDDPVLKTINLFLVYNAIEFALTSGRNFDFEGSMLRGVEAFCRLMGGRQVPVYRVQKSASLRYSLLRAARQIKNDRKKT